jgi:hypothetical protein
MNERRAEPGIINVGVTTTLIDTRDKLPFHDLTISVPVLAILDRASTHARKGQLPSTRSRERHGLPFEITASAMNEDSNEERRVEIRNWRCSPNRQAPSQTLQPISNIILWVKHQS